MVAPAARDGRQHLGGEPGHGAIQAIADDMKDDGLVSKKNLPPSPNASLPAASSSEPSSERRLLVSEP